MAHNGSILLFKQSVVMPSFKEGELDSNGQPMKSPPTPPHEPSYQGLALDNIPALVEHTKETSALPTTNGVHADEKSTISNSKGTPYHDPALDDLTPRSPSSRLPVPITTSSHFGGRHASISGHELDARRANGEVSLSPQERQSVLSTKHSRERLRDTTRSSEISSIAVFSPTLTDPLDSGTRSHGPWKSLDRPNEGRILPPVSPDLRNNLRRTSNERALDSKKPRNLTINVNPNFVVPDGAPSSGRPRVPRALSTPASVKSPTGSISHENRRPQLSSRPEPPKPRNLVIPSHRILGEGRA